MSIFNIFKQKKEKPTIIISNCAFNCPRKGGKEGCPKWVTFDFTYIAEGEKKTIKQENCADAWVPILLSEMKEIIKGK